MLAFLRCQKIHLTPAWCKSSSIFPPNAEEHQLGDITEIEANPTPIWAHPITHIFA